MTNRKIIFHSNQLSERGTEVALYNMALYSKEILGYDCMIMSSNKKVEKSSFHKFRYKFPVYMYDTVEEREDLLSRINHDWFYAMKGGANDGVISKYGKNFIHTVFQRVDPHGEIYTFISEWLATVCMQPNNFLPYIVPPPTYAEQVDIDFFKKYINIPEGHIVIGRHGGKSEFNIPFVHEAIKNVLKQRDDIHFVLLNTDIFYTHKNIIYIEGTTNPQHVNTFIQQCDAMLHARVNGESFGMAIAEFLANNKPVITWRGGMDKNHIQMLNHKGIYYSDQEHLEDILMTFDKNHYKNKDYSVLIKEFSPEKVIKKFDRMLTDYERTV